MTAVGRICQQMLELTCSQKNQEMGSKDLPQTILFFSKICSFEAGIVVKQIKLPPAAPASHKDAALRLIQLPANLPKKAAKVGPNPCVPTLVW